MSSLNGDERRRQAREQRKTQREQDQSQGQNSDRSVPRGWVGEFLDRLVEYQEMPERATRQWVVAHSLKDELGTVPYGGEEGAYAIFWPECDHLDEDCDCWENPAVMWEFVEEEYRW